MSLIKRKECKTKVDYRVVTCPNCGARIEIKTMKHRYIVLLLFLVVIFASIIYLNRNIAPTSSTSLSPSQPNSDGVIEKKDEAKKVEAEAPEKPKAETAAQAKVEALKAKVATQGAEAIGVEKATNLPSLQTVRAVFPHTAFQSRISSSGLTSHSMSFFHSEKPMLGKISIWHKLM